MTIMNPNVCYYCTEETRWKACVGSRLIFEIGNNSRMSETGHPQNPNQPVKLHPNAFGSEFTLYDKHMAGVEEYDPSQTACSSRRSPAPSFKR